MKPGWVVVLDEIDAVTGDRFTGYVTGLTRDTVVAVRCYRSRLDRRIVSTMSPARIVDAYPGSSRDMDRAAAELATAKIRMSKGDALDASMVAADLTRLAQARREEEVEEARERGAERAGEFNTGMAERRS